MRKHSSRHLILLVFILLALVSFLLLNRHHKDASSQYITKFNSFQWQLSDGFPKWTPTFNLANYYSRQPDVSWKYPHFDQKLSRSVELGSLPLESWKSAKLVWIAEEYHADQGVLQVQSSAGFIEKKILTKLSSGSFVALDLDGQVVWSYDSPRGDFAKRGWSSALIDGQYKLFASEGRFLKCISVDDGKSCNNFGVDGYVPICSESRSNPIIRENTIAIFGYSFCITTVQLSDGKVILNKFLNEAKKDNHGSGVWSNSAYYEKGNSGIVVTGNPKPVFDGRTRPGNNEHANSVVSVDLSSGQIKWSFQETAHDIWDLDIAVPPIVTTLKKDRLESVDVVIAASKRGNTLILDAATGELLNKFELVESIKSKVEGEFTPDYRMQILSPTPFSKMDISTDDLTFLKRYNPEEYSDALERLNAGVSGVLKPHEPGKTSFFFGINGGAQWPGGAFDSISETFFIASNHIPWAIEFKDSNSGNTPGLNSQIQGYDVFKDKCLVCHAGNLKVIFNKLHPLFDEAVIKKTLTEGFGQMPSVDVSDRQMESLINFLGDENAFVEEKPQLLDYNGFTKFSTSTGYPVTNPPWGVVNSISLSGDDFNNLWNVPIGNTQLGEKLGLRTGTEVFGGVTHVDSGVLILSGTRDNKVFVLNASNGDVLFEHTMLLHGAAAPTVFRSDGVVYFFVQATGLGKLGALQEHSDRAYYYLFALN